MRPPRFDLFFESRPPAGGGLPLPPNEPTPPPPPGKKPITCEFCACRLSPAGDYLELSDRAKGFRRSEEIIGEKDAEISTLRAEIASLRAQLPPKPDAKPAGGKAGWF